MTEWRAIPGYEGYVASDQGQIRSVARVRVFVRRGKPAEAQFKGKLLTPSPDDKGYPRVTLRQGRGPCRIHVHILVARAFLGYPPAGHEACHNDGNSSNPKLANLRYDTRKGNHADMLKHGTRLLGERSPRAKLTEAAAREILKTTGCTKALAAKFSVAISTVKSVRRGRTWGHLNEASA